MKRKIQKILNLGAKVLLIISMLYAIAVVISAFVYPKLEKNEEDYDFDDFDLFDEDEIFVEDDFGDDEE